MPRPRRLYAVLAAGAALVVAPLAVAATPAAAATPTVALVGSLQSELGCSDDWQPACTDTELARVGDSSPYQGTFDVPDGSYEFKVALDDSWDVNYGAGGVLDGPNMPLVLEGPAKLEFTYDHATHLTTFTPRGCPTAPPRPTRSWRPTPCARR